MLRKTGKLLPPYLSWNQPPLPFVDYNKLHCNLPNGNLLCQPYIFILISDFNTLLLISYRCFILFRISFPPHILNMFPFLLSTYLGKILQFFINQIDFLRLQSRARFPDIQFQLFQDPIPVYHMMSSTAQCNLLQHTPVTEYDIGIKGIRIFPKIPPQPFQMYLILQNRIKKMFFPGMAVPLWKNLRPVLLRFISKNPAAVIFWLKYINTRLMQKYQIYLCRFPSIFRDITVKQHLTVSRKFSQVLPRQIFAPHSCVKLHFQKSILCLPVILGFFITDFLYTENQNHTCKNARKEKPYCCHRYPLFIL